MVVNVGLQTGRGSLARVAFVLKNQDNDNPAKT